MGAGSIGVQVNHELNVITRNDRVEVKGDLRLQTMGKLTSAIHHLVRRGWTDIELDFTSLTSITSSCIPPISAFLRLQLLNNKVDFVYGEPANPALKARLRTLGLAHYISHRSAPKPRNNSADPSVLQFLNHEERETAVDKVVNSALRTMKLGAQQVAGLEWAVNEITDNVLTHSNSRVGGFLICNKISDNILEFTVADAGIGIRRSLGLDTDEEALEKAIQEGVTRNKVTNQGNGLYGTYRLALVSSGVFVLRSGHGNLFVTKEGGMHIKADPILYQGTYVVCQVDLARPDLVERALVIGGKSHTIGFDYIERLHETEGGDYTVSAKDICKTFGSRQSGFEARRYIENLLEIESAASITIDFSDVHVVSSSFADEVFGKLFLSLGPMAYMRRIKLTNTVSTVDGLIDRAITLRSRTGL